MFSKLAWGDFPLSQLFGEPHQRYTDWGLAGHNGMDLAMPVGTELVAPLQGEVLEVGWDPTGYGNYVKLRLFSGGSLLYAHLSEVGVRKGQWRDAGFHIGHSGNTGASTGPHLHLGYRPDEGYRGGGFNGYGDPLLILPLQLNPQDG